MRLGEDQVKERFWNHNIGWVYNALKENDLKEVVFPLNVSNVVFFNIKKRECNQDPFFPV